MNNSHPRAIILIVCTVLFPLLAEAQFSYYKVIGGAQDDAATTVEIDENGNIFLGGYFDNGSDRDAVVAGFKDCGDLLGTRMLATSAADQVTNLLVDGNRLLTIGNTFSTGVGDYFLLGLKTDLTPIAGALRYFGSATRREDARSIVKSPNGYLIGGQHPGSPGVPAELFLTEISNTGVVLSTKTMVSALQTNLIDLNNIGSSLFMSVGSNYNGASCADRHDLQFTVFDADLNVVTSRLTVSGTIGTEEYGRSSVFTGGKAFLIGSTSPSAGVDRDATLRILSTTGAVLKSIFFGTTGDEVPIDIIEHSSGVLVAGMTDGAGAGAYDIFLSKFDLSGNLLWTKTYGTTADESYGDLLRDYHDIVSTDPTSGDIIIVGRTNDPAQSNGGYDALLIRTDIDGNMAASCDISEDATFTVTDVPTLVCTASTSLTPQSWNKAGSLTPTTIPFGVNSPCNVAGCPEPLPLPEPGKRPLFKDCVVDLSGNPVANFEGTVEILDASGEQVFFGMSKKGQSIEAPSLPGNYILKVDNGDASQRCKIVVK